MDLILDEPICPRPRPKAQRSAGKTWLMRGFFMTLHLGLLGGVLAYLDVHPPSFSHATPPPATPTPATPPPSTQAPLTKTPKQVQAESPAVRPAPIVVPPRVVNQKPKAKPRPAPPVANSEIKTTSLAEARGTAIQEAPRKTPEEALGEKGLRQRNGKWLLIDGEDKASQQLAKLNAAFNAATTVVNRLAAIKQIDITIAQWRAQRIQADLDVEALSITLAATPSRGNNLIVANYQAIRNQWLARRADSHQLKQNITDLNGQLPSPGERQKLAADRTRLLEAFRTEVYGLRGQSDPVDARYEELRKDGEVAQAIRESGGGGGNGATLGPSGEFTLMRQELVRAERLASKN